MYYIIQYIKHLLTATNQHGVHSPFVYNYLTKCLYTKPKYKGSKSENIVLKSIPYFSLGKVFIVPKDSPIENKILMELELKASEEAPFDFVYLDNPKENVISKDKIHNDSIIFIKNIHKTKSNSTTWETLKAKKIVTVSIDMYHCGLLFFRKEQEKEHFKIRI